LQQSWHTEDTLISVHIIWPMHLHWSFYPLLGISESLYTELNDYAVWCKSH